MATAPQDLFQAIDDDNSGELSRAEVAQLMVDQGISVDEKYLDGVLDAYDLDQSGEIDIGADNPHLVCESVHVARSPRGKRAFRCPVLAALSLSLSLSLSESVVTDRVICRAR